MEEKNKIVIEMLTPNSGLIDRKLPVIPMAVCVRCLNEVPRKFATQCDYCHGSVWQLTNMLGNR